MKLLVTTAFAVSSIVFLPTLLQAAGPVPVTDANGDGRPGHADIKSVTAAGTDTTVTWTIVAYHPFATAKAPCVDIVSVQPGGLRWTICGTAKNGFGIETSSPYQRGGGFSGTASVLRPSPTTVVYRVQRAYISAGAAMKPKPHGYSWQVQVRDQPDCVTTACDSAPDATRVALPG